MKKIVVAPDSFKGSLTSAEVADAVEERNATLPATEKVDIKHK